MAHLTEVPCRVSADLRRHEREQHRAELDRDQFDEHDEAKVAAVVGRELTGPVMSLLSILNEIEMADRIGGLNKERACEWLRPHLEKLRAGCLERWEQL